MESTLPTTQVPDVAPVMRQRRKMPDALRRLLRSPGPVLGLIIVAIFLLISLTAQWIAPHDYEQANFSMARKGPSAEHWLGNDELGRDLFSRLLHGARLSLIIGIISVSIGLLIGLPIGLISGYAGGRTDLVSMRFMDILLAFPSILLAILLVATFGPGLNNAMIAIGIVSIPIYARLVRSSTLANKNELYVEASRSTGASGLRILFRHIFPNTTAPVVVQSTLQIAAAILAAAALRRPTSPNGATCCRRAAPTSSPPRTSSSSPAWPSC